MDVYNDVAVEDVMHICGRPITFSIWHAGIAPQILLDRVGHF